MIDHRRIQRTLLRMQLDPRFATALLAGDAHAVASTALGKSEIALVRTADPVGLAADREGARRAQFLRNVCAEFGLSTAVAAASEHGFDFAEGFLESSELHAAIADGVRLAYAFGEYAARHAAAAADRELAALVELERAMVRARRTLRTVPELAADELALAGHASVCALPSGTFELAARVRTGLDAGERIDRARMGDPLALERTAAEEIVLLTSHATSAHRLREVCVERLEPLVAALLRAARTALGPRARAAFAAAHAVSPADVEGFAAALVAEGILVQG